MLPVLPDWEQTSWEFWAYLSYSLAQVMEMHRNKSSTSTSGTFQGCDLKSGCRSEGWPLSTDPIGLQMSQYQPWQHSEFSGLSLLQTQFPGCLFFSIQNDKSWRHFSLGASEMGSLVFSPSVCEGKRAQVICCCATAKHPPAWQGFLASASALCRCLFEFVRVCLGCCALMSTNYLGYNSASELVCFVPVMILQKLLFWMSRQRWCGAETLLQVEKQGGFR